VNNVNEQTGNCHTKLLLIANIRQDSFFVFYYNMLDITRYQLSCFMFENCQIKIRNFQQLSVKFTYFDQKNCDKNLPVLAISKKLICCVTCIFY